MKKKTRSNIYDGKIRDLYEKSCEQCLKLFLIPRHIYSETRYCSRRCWGLSRRRRVSVCCSTCKIQFERPVHDLKNSKHHKYFCSRRCKDMAQRIGGISEIQPPHYKDGKSKYRDRAFRKYGAVCIECGFSGEKRMLDVDHIDTDRENNKIENLQVLCVWCHALKTRNVKRGYSITRVRCICNA